MSGFNGVMHMQVQQGLQGMVKGRLMLQVGARGRPVRACSSHTYVCAWGGGHWLTASSASRSHVCRVCLYALVCTSQNLVDMIGTRKDSSEMRTKLFAVIDLVSPPPTLYGHISHSLTHRFTGSGAHLLAQSPSIKSPAIHISEVTDVSSRLCSCVVQVKQHGREVEELLEAIDR